MKAEAFNQSSFSCWVNSSKGRVFRLFAGSVFLITGIIFHNSPLGIASMIWSIFPLSAGIFDLCYISGVMGGPFRGSKIRALQAKKSPEKH